MGNWQSNIVNCPFAFYNYPPIYILLSAPFVCNTNYDLILNHEIMADVFKIPSSEGLRWVLFDDVMVLYTV
jgi:hypothetical protein